MSRIKLLPEEVSRQIAAGEVVERPASVVKELVENALDAGASAISIAVERAGVGLVEVRDNGAGMSREDAVLATKSFSTSKIGSAADLFRVATYGFRGEALASISSVSRLEVLTADDDNGEGWKVAIEGAVERQSEPAPHERGTTVRVQRLFFNTPARKKFLKSDITERRRIMETVLAFALVRPDVEFHYRDDARGSLDLVATEVWRERVAAILGGSTMEHMVEVSAPRSPFRLDGFISLPTYTRANRNQQFMFVNKRLVKERTIQQAIHQAYRTVVPAKRFPAVVLSLEVPVEMVDVNVHPNKLEVRLENERRVFDAVYHAVKQGLSGASESSMEVGYHDGSVQRPRGAPGGALRVIEGAGAHLSEGGTRPARSPVVDYRERVKRAYGSFADDKARGADSGAGSLREFNPQLSLSTAAREEGEGADVSKGKDRGELKGPLQGDEALFWQFDDSYIFIQVKGGIVVIDQHAAHERIIFDTCKQRLENEIPISQQILFPIQLELSLAELEVFRNSKDTFQRLGFQLEPFGGTTILVRGYPQGLKNWEEGRLLRQIFDDLIEDRVAGQSHTEKIIASFACRSAVRAGQKLSVREMKMLADQLFAVPNPYSCPHGRPTIQRISLEEVEGWFDRR